MALAAHAAMQGLSSLGSSPSNGQHTQGLNGQQPTNGQHMGVGSIQSNSIRLDGVGASAANGMASGAGGCVGDSVGGSVEGVV
jgi:hypothetical protein